MDAVKLKILEENLSEYLEQATQASQRKKYNAAATLFFKAICAAIDLYLLKTKNIVPSSHTERFRIVQQEYPEIYEILDKDFPFYQDSYTKKMNKEIVEVLQEDAFFLTKKCTAGKK